MTDSAVLAALITSVAALIGSLVTAKQVRQELRRIEIEKQAIEAEFGQELSAERAAKRLLECTEWKRRTFDALRYHFGGYEDDELRRLLIRAGALRFFEDVETWGLLSRNVEEIEDESFTNDF